MDEDDQPDCQQQRIYQLQSPVMSRMNSEFQWNGIQYNYDSKEEEREIIAQQKYLESYFYKNMYPEIDVSLKKNSFTYDDQEYFEHSFSEMQSNRMYCPNQKPDLTSPVNNNMEETAQKVKDRHKKQKNSQKFFNKSFCRYILLYAFRTLENCKYSDYIEAICARHGVNSQLFKLHYSKQRLVILGYQVLKRELIWDDSQDEEIVKRKKAFQDYLIWYLSQLATKDILNSKKKDLREYIKFKNYVMSYYVKNPTQWNGNKAEWI